MLRLVLAGSVAVLTLLMAVACGGGDSPTSTVGSRWQRWVRGHSCAHINRGSRWQRWVPGHSCAHINRGQGRQRQL